jgi:fermentation-respiration switch protein FrsA (DUF1100 family)
MTPRQLSAALPASTRRRSGSSAGRSAAAWRWRVASGAGGTSPFHAVAGFSTGGFGVELLAATLPPTILLSGGRTDAIPLSETLPLYDALRAAHVPSALYVYPHGSHNWPGRQGTLGIQRAATFLKHHLR